MLKCGIIYNVVLLRTVPTFFALQCQPGFMMGLTQQILHLIGDNLVHLILAISFISLDFVFKIFNATVKYALCNVQL